MSRAASGDVVTVPASSNMYTGLAAAATVGVALAVLVLFLRAKALGVELF